MDIEIKRIDSNAELAKVVELQKLVWKLNDYGDCIPVHVLLSANHTGGAVFAAYDNNIMVGFLVIMAAFSIDHEYYHHSHIMGIHPEWSNMGIGLDLKKTHRSWALEKGVKKVTWTFDPLLGANASLNINKLGAVVRRYLVNYYGDIMGESGLVSGIPSDRFWIEWFIGSERVKKRMSGKNYKTSYNINEFLIANEVVRKTQQIQILESINPDFSQPKFLIEIPADFQKIYDLDIGAAKEWHGGIRDLFIKCFNNDYTITDFFRIKDKKFNRNFYLLEKNFSV